MSDKDTKDTSARCLAQYYYETQPEITGIFRLNAPATEQEQSEPIKLLEVNPETVPTGITPLTFPPIPASGCFPLVIVEVTPAEFDEVRRGRLPLPNGWQLEESPLPRA